MLIQIIESDKKYQEDFKAWLIQTNQAKETENPLQLEVPDDFDMDLYHGIEEASLGSFSEQFPDVVEWLTNYQGNFEYYLSLKSQFELKGTLTPKQIDSVIRAIEKDKAREEASKNVQYSIKAGAIIVVNRWIAADISAKIGRKIKHFTFQVVECLGETDKAYRLTVKLSAAKTTRCGVCGTRLDNATSIAAGIGPICADKTGISYGDNSLSELKEKLEDIVVTSWIPKTSIKEILNNS